MMAWLVLLAILGLSNASPHSHRDPKKGPATSNILPSLTLLFPNNLNFTDDANHVSSILLSPMTQIQGASACASISEALLPMSSVITHQTDFLIELSYQEYAGRAASLQQYWIQDSVLSVDKNLGQLSFPKVAGRDVVLPVLCTNSASGNKPKNSVATTASQVKVHSNGNTFIGFRNQKSFRFQGIPYADPPERFVYSHLYSGTGQTINATTYGSDCAQRGENSSSEDCLFINIQTPYIPRAGDTTNLRPIYFYIHGGGFTGGQGSADNSDGGQLASREDIVVVTLNYRLSTLGFLAIPGTNITGNYGIADQIVALDWVIANIAAFGGDASKIVINGASAGAGSVRTLLGSPKAIGKFRGSIAMSSLGGGIGLGDDYATTYANYYTIEQSYQRTKPLFADLGCDGTLEEQIACLKALPALDVVSGNATFVARFVVQDGVYVNTQNLDVYNNGGAANINTIWGVLANDGTALSKYPKAPVTSELEGIVKSINVSESYAQAIIDSGLFPFYDSGNLTLDAFNVSQRVTTDVMFRCIDQATVYAGAQTGAFKDSYYYQLDRSGKGYNPNNLPGPPVEPGYPFGNPYKPYFRDHGSDMPWFFGQLDDFRDDNDLISIQLTTSYFASFVRTLSPNAPEEYLRVRGHTNTTTAVQRSGPWEPVTSETGPIKRLDYVSLTDDFQDLPQCAWLNYPIDFYTTGGV